MADKTVSGATSTTKTVKHVGALSCWTTTKTERGSNVDTSHFDVPLTGDFMADRTAAARVLLELVRLVRASDERGRWSLKFSIERMLREVCTTDTEAARWFRRMAVELMCGGIVFAESEAYALAELDLAEKAAERHAASIAKEKAEFVQRMKAARAAKRQAAAVQVLSGWPAPARGPAQTRPA